MISFRIKMEKHGPLMIRCGIRVTEVEDET